MREHVVVAMVGKEPAKVECTSCKKQHAYRSSPPSAVKEKAPPKAPRTITRSRRSSVPVPEPIDLGPRLAARAPVRYDPQHRFVLDDVVEHPSFGIGVVVSLPGAQKINVQFPSGPKVLSHDRGASVAPSLERPARRDEGAGPKVSDAPERHRT